MARDVRKPPISAVLKLHKQGVRGWCGWCGQPCTDKTPGRGWLKWFHDACSEEMAIIEQPDRARRAVFARDKGGCCDCGEDWSERFQLVPEFYLSVWAEERYQGGDSATLGPDGKRLVRTSTCDGFVYVCLKGISLWHVDHKVPLWKVQHLPDLKRLEYFKLANLITRCHRCHQFKTTKEAAERAKFKGMASGAPAKPKAKWASRPMGKRPAGTGNGFPPRGSTPMRRK